MAGSEAVSLEIKATIICDGCGAKLEGKTQTRSTEYQSSYKHVKREWKKLGWIVNLRYGPACHYCPACLDKPQKPPALVRKPKRVYPPCKNIIRDLPRTDEDNEGEEWKQG